MRGRLRKPRNVRTLLFVFAAGVAISAGVAWAAGPNVTKAPGFDLARTYRVTLGPDDNTVISWGKVGNVELTTELGNSWDSGEGSGATPGYAAGGKALITTNNGSTPVSIASGPDWPGGTVVEPAGSEAFGFVGEFVTQDLPRDSMLLPLAIMSEDKTSATGFLAVSAAIAPDGTAHFTVSLQLKG